MKKCILLLVCALISTTGIFSANEVTVSGSLGQDGTYSTLTAAGGAFAALNAANQTGRNITIAISATTVGEDGTYALTGAAGMWTSLTIYPTNTGVTIGANIAKPLIDLNGADNVTINGAVNNTGTTKSMIITNTNNTNTAGNTTIRFINDATGNTIKNCIIKGATIDAAAGVIFFSTAAVTGNDNNLIDNNDITNSSTSGAGVATDRPINAVYSAGTATYENSGITISNNNIFNTLRFGDSSNMISLGANSTDCTISGNSLYETASFVASASKNYVAINISASTGVNFSVTGNNIGGQDVLCGGNAWTKTSQNCAFTAISLSVGTSTVSSVQNNTIKNFSWTNSSGASFTGIAASGSGNVNIGTTTGNTIQDIILTNGGTNGYLYGINISSTGTIDCQNNTVTSLSTSNAATNNTHITGINYSAAGSINIRSNTVTYLTANSASTGQVQSVFGINTSGAATIQITFNTISNLDNKTTNANTSTAGVVIGINCSNSTSVLKVTITDNQINDLKIANLNANRTTTASAVGIASLQKIVDIERNTIYNVSNTNTGFTGNVIGICISGGNPSLFPAQKINSNFIYNISNSVTTSTTDSIFGMKIMFLTDARYYNNIISLSTNSPSTVCGIFEKNQGNYSANNIFNNTVYIAGSPNSGSSNSFALFSQAGSNPRKNIQNNIFYNARSNSGSANGKHYAAYFNSNINLTLNYNNYFVSGSGGILGYYGGDVTSGSVIVSDQDANSVSSNPGISNPGNTAVSYKGTTYSVGVSTNPIAVLTGNGTVTSNFNLTSDFEGTTRTTPQIGAFFIPTIVPVNSSTTDPAGLTAASQLEVAAGAELTFTTSPNVSKIILAPTAKLTMGANTITAPNGVVLQSDATGTATLTGDNAVTNATVQQYVTAGRNWYISPSVSSATYSTLSRGTSVVEWNEATKAWDTKSSGTLTAGRGYIQVATSTPSVTGTTGTVNFTGTTNAGDIPVTVTRTESGSSRGFNLVGNPYPSYLKWDDFYTESGNAAAVLNSFWFRTLNKSDQYVFTTYNGASHEVVGGSEVPTDLNNFIPPMQAFWVRVKQNMNTGDVNYPNNVASITFKNNMRGHIDAAGNTSNNKFKAPKDDERRSLRLQLSNGNFTDESLIYFDSNAANDFDDYDSPKMMNNSTLMPDIYSKSGSEKVVINGLNAVSDNLELPLGFTLKAAATGLKFRVSELSNFSADTKVYLQDKVRNTQTELAANSEYSFDITEAAVNNESRFSLLFRAPNAPTALNNTEKLNAQVFVNSANKITIVAPEKSNYAIYNAMGQLIENGVLNMELQTVNCKLQTGIYVVRVGNESKPVIIK